VGSAVTIEYKRIISNRERLISLVIMKVIDHWTRGDSLRNLNSDLDSPQSLDGLEISVYSLPISLFRCIDVSHVPQEER
jgi:hypothetical protein